MSVHYLSACWKLEGLTSTQKFVLVSLADQANDEGVCWPSIGSIAQRTCLTERAVQLAMRELIALNLVQKDERVNRSSVFTVTPERHSGEPRSPVNHIHQGGEPRSPGGEPRSPEGRTTFTQNRNRTVNEPPKNQKAVTFVPPDWLDVPLWEDFIEMRKKMKKPPTERAMTLLVRELKRIIDQGYSQQEVIENSIKNCWQDFYAPKRGMNGNNGGFVC